MSITVLSSKLTFFSFERFFLRIRQGLSRSLRLCQAQAIIAEGASLAQAEARHADDLTSVIGQGIIQRGVASRAAVIVDGEILARFIP